MSMDTPAFEAGMGELLKELGSSHTAFFHQRRDSIPAPYSISATLRAVDSPQGKRWMFVDVIEDGVAFQAGIQPGELLLSIDSQPVLPPKSQTSVLAVTIAWKSAVSTAASGKSPLACQTVQPKTASDD